MIDKNAYEQKGHKTENRKSVWPGGVTIQDKAHKKHILGNFKVKKLRIKINGMLVYNIMKMCF